MPKIKLLLVADDQDTAATVSKVATGMLFSVHRSNGRDFKTQYEDLNPEIVVVDILMAHMEGFEVLNILKSKQSTSTILLLSGRQQSYQRLVEHLSMAAKLNIHANLPKPFREMELRQELREIQMSLLVARRSAFRESLG